jgi:hypothetical protein
VQIGFGRGASGKTQFQVNGLILTAAAVIGTVKITLDT